MTDDAHWRRPEAPAGGTGADAETAGAGDAGPAGSALGATPTAGQAPPVAGYQGPPPTTPPPSDWRPPLVVRPAPPRPLPRQDHESLDLQEQSARTLTLGIGMVAGAILLVVLCALCARAVL